MERNRPYNEQAVKGGRVYDSAPLILYLADRLSMFYADFVLCRHDYHGSLHGEMQ